jgi:hypothetical protein
MREVLLVAGVPIEQIRMRNGCHKIQTCAKAFDWLHQLYISPEFKELERVYNLLPVEVWIRYNLLEVTDTREQLMLIKAKDKVIKLWRKKRPQLFGKDRAVDVKLLDVDIRDRCRA